MKRSDNTPLLVISFGFVCAFILVGSIIQQAQAMSVNITPRQQREDAFISYYVYLPLVFKGYSDVPSGKVVFVSHRYDNVDIYSMNIDGSAITRLTTEPSSDNSPDWSPDGSKIAFISNRSGEFEVYVMDADGSNQTQITTLNECDSPKWSPDGTSIAFFSRQNNDNIVYTMNPDGSDLFPVTDPATSGYDPYWSPDGLRIAFFSVRSTPGIYVIDADGTDQSLLMEGSGIGYFAWSPDGRMLALSKNVLPNFNLEILLYNLSTGSTIRLTETTATHNSVDWSPDGNRLIFHSNRDDGSNFEVYIMSLDGTHIQNITNDPAADSAPDWIK